MGPKQVERPPHPVCYFDKPVMDGHMVAAISRGKGMPSFIHPTAVVADYPRASHTDCETNDGILSNSPWSKQLAACDCWVDKQGVCFTNVGQGLNSDAVVGEFWGRFKDDTFSLKGTNQFVNQRVLKGGWLTPYFNTLVTDDKEQQRSVLAVPKAEFKSFRTVCPVAEQVVQAVKQALYKMVPEYKNKLESTEYTYFLGVSKASCTKWHSDSEEHDNVWLLFSCCSPR